MAGEWVLLGTATAKALAKLWFRDRPLEESLSGSLIDYLSSRTQSEREARAAGRVLERVGDRISSDLESYFSVEFRGLASNEKQAAIHGVATALLSIPLDFDSIAATDFDDAYLAHAIMAYRKGLDLSDAANEFFSLLARELAVYIINAMLGLPDSPARIGVTILRREEEAFAAIDDQLTRLPKRVANEIATAAENRGAQDLVSFELMYRRLLVRRLDHLTLFGLDASDDTGSAYNLSVAYVSLTVRQTGDRSIRLSLRVEDALAQADTSRPVVITGEAGSGKTTILQWLAVQAARRKFEGELEQWNDKVPFFLRLRDYTGDRRLPRPSSLVADAAQVLADQQPERWAVQRLQAGRALILIDGLDELAEGRRSEVDEWLADLHTSYPRATYVVTTRPTARLASLPVEALSVEAMDGPDVLAFIDHWHRAAARTVRDHDAAQDLVRVQARLTAALSEVSALPTLASNALLCALLCAMNRRRRGLLPEGRMDLYGTALSMLLRRDSQRGLRLAENVLGEEASSLLLADLAYWMMRNDQAVVGTEQAEQRVERKLVSLPHVDIQPKECLRYLVERTGLLREATEGHLEFAHLTFQDFSRPRKLPIRTMSAVYSLV